jgi:probable HAF family extracellular repeat protein
VVLIVGFFGDRTGTHGFLDTGGSFTQIDVPGAKVTLARGINDAGQIVGTFENNPGSTPDRGFLATPISQVPEPSTLALLGVGMFGFGLLRRRRNA